MAGSLSLQVLPPNSVPKLSSQEKSGLRQTENRSFNSRSRHAIGLHFRKHGSTKLRAGLSAVEPDLNEDQRDIWATNGIDEEDFVYGIYDGHHTYFESDERGSFWGDLAEDYNVGGPPTGFQGIMSWIFPPAIAAGMYFNAPGEYLYIGAAIFTVIFCVIEMNKPSEPHNFEPQIYNMERGARDKLIANYNTMDIWDFNEKYGELWDFTIETDETVNELKKKGLL